MRFVLCVDCRSFNIALEIECYHFFVLGFFCKFIYTSLNALAKLGSCECSQINSGAHFAGYGPSNQFI